MFVFDLADLVYIAAVALLVVIGCIHWIVQLVSGKGQRRDL